MNRARQRAEAAFATDPDDAEANAALTEHQSAVQRWLASPAEDRPHHWRAVEAAWRRVKKLGATSDAQHNAATLARAHAKIRSPK